MRTLIVAALSFLFITSCDEKDVVIYKIDPPLELYVETFYSEASERNVTIPQNLIAEFKHIQGISQADRVMDQNYVRFNPELMTLNDRQIEAHIYYRMAQVFLNIDISEGESFANPAFMFEPYNPDNRDAMFDNLFENR